MNKFFSKFNRQKKPKQKRSLGQVFLKDKWPCERMAENLEQEGITHVLEIGPGAAVLTRELLKKGFQVTCVEKDERYVGYLKDELTEFIHEKNRSLQIIHADILHFDLTDWLTRMPDTVAICGNIPYNISTPILAKVLPLISRIHIVTFLVQLEFGQRLCALPSTKNYGSLTVFTQLRSRVNLDFKVSKQCFSPIPKVDSAVVSLKRPVYQYQSDLLKNVESLTKLAFTMRRKKLSNALGELLHAKNQDESPVSLELRPDAISPDQFLDLARFVFE